MNDVFISYVRADHEWVVTELVPRMEKAGLGVWIDSHDYLSGEPFLEETERAIAESRHVLLVLRRSSPWRR